MAPFVRATGSFLWSALENLGIMTLVFALVERAIRHREAAGKAWDPSALPPVNDPDRISYFGRIFALYVIAALALLFNFFPDWVAVYVFRNSDASVYPLLTPDFSPLPAAHQRVVAPRLRPQSGGPAPGPLDAADPVGRLRPRGWLGAVILLLIVLGPPVFRYDYLTKVIAQWFLIFSAINACVLLYRLLRRRPAEPWARA